MVDAFFLETPKDNRKKALAVDPAKGKTEKSSIFHRTVEMKQPHTITELKTKKGFACEVLLPKSRQAAV